jgi:hypothetical protein
MRPPRADLPAAGVGIASQKPLFERISGPVSCAPMITGAFDQTSAAAFRLSLDFGKLANLIEFASRVPKPAPVICPLCQGSCPLLYFSSISQVGGIGR